MKIGIACYPTYGGSGVVATELGIALAKRGHEIHFITYDQPFRLQGWHDNVYFHAVDVVTYPLFKYPPYTLAAASKLIQVVQTHHLDILHAHYAIPHTICALMARDVIGSGSVPLTPSTQGGDALAPSARSGSGLRIVTTLHGTDITLIGSDPSFYSMTKYGIERSDAVTAVSRYLRHETIRKFGVDRPIDVIYNFVDPDKYKPRQPGQGPCERSLFASSGEKIVMHISNFRPVKRIGDVVRAFEVMRRRVPAKLVLIGDGPDLPEARTLAESLKVAEDVIYLGRQDCVETLLPCADLFLLPSEHESFGLTALEALSCGVPVIATLGSGIEEVVRNGKDGSLHKVGDHAAMGAAGAEILTSPERLAAMREAAREGVDRFHTERIVPLYEQVYERVLAADVNTGRPGAGDSTSPGPLAGTTPVAAGTHEGPGTRSGGGQSDA